MMNMILSFQKDGALRIGMSAIAQMLTEKESNSGIIFRSPIICYVLVQLPQ